MPTLNAYSLLARIYDDAGFSTYVNAITPRLVNELHKTGWMGRRIVDLGCGTGASSAYFLSNNMDVFGIDLNPDMLKVAHMRTDGIGFCELTQGDLRTVTFPDEADLVYAMGNVFNELNSLKELEAVFQKAHTALQQGRRFVFDLFTLRGLGEFLGHGEQILDTSDRLFMTVQNSFNYENMSLRQAFTVFMRNGENNWERNNAYLTLRGYPLAGVNALLERTGFNIVQTYDSFLRPFDPHHDRDGRVIFIVEKA